MIDSYPEFLRRIALLKPQVSLARRFALLDPEAWRAISDEIQRWEEACIGDLTSESFQTDRLPMIQTQIRFLRQLRYLPKVKTQNLDAMEKELAHLTKSVERMQTLGLHQGASPEDLERIRTIEQMLEAKT